MPSVFVSHSSQDRKLTEEICGELTKAGVAAFWVDFDPDNGIPAGRNWERELYAQLRRTNAVVFIASPASVESRWCFAELALARSLNRPIIAVRVEGAELDLLRDVQWIDLDDTDSVVGRLRAGFRAAGLDPQSSFRWDPHRSPYPGLAPFVEQDAAVFFGREKETKRLVELLQPTLQHGSGRFVTIVGPSGSGKSSLLQAGLLPRLARQGHRWVLLPPLRPDSRFADSPPMDLLARSLSVKFEELGLPRTTSEIRTTLDTEPQALVTLCRELAQRAPHEWEQPSVLVSIDQGEELLTNRRGGEALMRLLADALGDDSPLWVVATLRSEFLSGAPDRAVLAEAIDDSLVVEPLSTSRLVEVISEPAREAGVELAPGLAERMAVDTAGGDALPLLAYTLRELCERAGTEGRITFSDYDAVGGVVGALRRRADRIYEELQRSGHGDRVLDTLAMLVDVGPDDELTGRRLPRGELDDDRRVVIDAFVNARLLVNRSDPDDPRQGTWVEVAHLALLRQWPPLRTKIDDDRVHLRLRSDLQRSAEYWDENQRDESYLLEGTRLAVADQWATEYSDELESLAKEFLDESRARTTRQLEEVKRSNDRLRRLRNRLFAALGVLLLAFVAVAVAVQRERAQAQLAWSRQFALQADRLVDTQPDVAILAGLQSLSMNNGTAPPEGLASGLARVAHSSRLLRGHVGPVVSVSFARDGALLATAGYDGSVRLWDAATGAPHGRPLDGVNVVDFSPDGGLVATAAGDRSLRLWDVATGQAHGSPLIGHNDLVTGVTFSADGRLLASSSTDGTARLWDVSTGRPRGLPLTGHTGGVNGVAFSPDGQLLATAGVDHTVRMWDVATGQPHGTPLTGHAAEVTSVTFSPDGRLLASTSGDGTTRQWDVATGLPHAAPLGGSEIGWLNAAAFSPDQTLLATAGNDQSVRLWDVATGLPHGLPLNGHTDRVNGVRFSPDGRILASVSADQTIRLWDVSETYSISHPLTGHTGMVAGVAFSPDGRLLATAGVDRTLRLWNVATGKPRGLPLTGHVGWVNAVAFSPDGRLLASASEDHTVRLWDVATGQPYGPVLAGHTLAVSALAFSPDGTLLATASADQTVRLWNVETGQPQGLPLIGHNGPVNSVAFSPDGRVLASAGFDRRARLWEVSTGHMLHAPLAGHTNQVNSVAFSPDGRLLATAGEDRTVRLWDVATGRPDGEPLIGHTALVSAVAFSPDGKTLASASGDKSVRLWDVATGRPSGAPMTGHTGWVRAVAFSRDGTLATGSGDGTARLWNTGFTTWMTAGCNLVNRNLSLDEWNQLAFGLPYQRTCPNLPAGLDAPSNSAGARYPASIR